MRQRFTGITRTETASKPTRRSAAAAAPALLIACGAALLSSCSGSFSAAEQAQIEAGRQIYLTHCAACHGQDLEGQPDWQEPNPDGTFKAPPHDASGHTWHHDDATILDRIRGGAAALPEKLQWISNMPAYEEILTEEEIQALLVYIKSSWPADIRRAQPGNDPSN